MKRPRNENGELLWDDRSDLEIKHTIAVEALEKIHKYFLDRVPEHREYIPLDICSRALEEMNSEIA